MTQVLETYICPHCTSPTFRKNGTENGIQRYKCKACNKTFRATTGTATHHLHKKLLIDKYIKALQKGLSVRKAAIEVGISKNTSFAWRHKFLTSISTHIKPPNDKAINGKGAKIIKLPYSDKGRRKPKEKCTKDSKNLLIVDNKQTFILKLKPQAPIKNATETLSKLKPHTYIASSPHKALNSAINKSGKIRLEKLSEPYINLNKQTETKTLMILEWMEKFQGVATKYLQNYWSWFSASERSKSDASPFLFLKELCITGQSRTIYFRIRNQ